MGACLNQPTVPSSHRCEASEEGLIASAPAAKPLAPAGNAGPVTRLRCSPISGFQRPNSPSQLSIASNGGRFTTATSAYLGTPAGRVSKGFYHGTGFASSSAWTSRSDEKPGEIDLQRERCISVYPLYPKIWLQNVARSWFQKGQDGSENKRRPVRPNMVLTCVQEPSRLSMGITWVLWLGLNPYQ